MKDEEKEYSYIPSFSSLFQLLMFLDGRECSCFYSLSCSTQLSMFILHIEMNIVNIKVFFLNLKIHLFILLINMKIFARFIYELQQTHLS